MMDQGIKSLIEISRFYGTNKEYVLAGGGNTSFKNKEHLWIKASGISLADIDEEGFVTLSREGLQKISTKEYSEDISVREAEVKEDLHNAIVSENGKRPSVETSMHEVIDYPFVVHTHPTLVNAVMCSQQAHQTVLELFGEQALFIEYTDPGYILFKKVYERIQEFAQKFEKHPKIIFLENHGVFVASDSLDEIKEIYAQIADKIKSKIKDNLPGDGIIPVDLEKVSEMIASIIDVKAYAFNSEIISCFSKDEASYYKVSIPFTPDNIVYCKSKYLFVDSEDVVISKIQLFEKKNGYLPKVIVFKGNGLIVLESSAKNANIVFETYSDMMKISLLSENFGGPQYMTAKQIEFIDNWEVENYRRKMAQAD